MALENILSHVMSRVREIHLSFAGQNVRRTSRPLHFEFLQDISL